MEEHRVAAVKVVYLSERTTQAERKALDREMRIHGALNDEHIIHFMDAVVVEKPGSYTPAVYILLELAAGGDLFDKIGRILNYSLGHIPLLTITLTVPDVGIDSETAKLYFQQLVDGTVCSFTYASTRGSNRDRGPPETHTPTRCRASRSQAGEHPSRCCRNLEDLRFWTRCGVADQGHRQATVFDRCLWELAIHRTRGEVSASVPVCSSTLKGQCCAACPRTAVPCPTNRRLGPRRHSVHPSRRKFVVQL
jgi:serine/threonine protein kinase